MRRKDFQSAALRDILAPEAEYSFTAARSRRLSRTDDRSRSRLPRVLWEGREYRNMEKSVFAAALEKSLAFNRKKQTLAMAGWFALCLSALCFYGVSKLPLQEAEFSSSMGSIKSIESKAPPGHDSVGTGERRSVAGLSNVSDAPAPSTLSVPNDPPLPGNTPSSALSLEAVFSGADIAYSGDVSAEAAFLINRGTFDVLYAHNADAVLPMASTTKIMTALIVLENCDLSEEVKVKAESCGVEGSSCYLVPGENITVEDLLYGLMLESGNDSAEALALHCAGSIPAFTQLMNDRAASLGLTRTHFDNPHGLSSDNHRTTARELALIACEAMRHPVFRTIVSTTSHRVEKDGVLTHYFINHNKLLRSYPGTIGVKTGYTLASGRCLVSCAKHEDGEYIAVTLNDRADWRDHKALYDYAFSSFDTLCSAKSGELCLYFGGKRYTNAADLRIMLPKDTKQYSLSAVLTASPSNHFAGAASPPQ